MIKSSCWLLSFVARLDWQGPGFGAEMETYVFRVEIEPDEEGRGAFYLPLEELGASTWGESREAALEHIQEVLNVMARDLGETTRQIVLMRQGMGGSVEETASLLAVWLCIGHAVYEPRTA